jgi:hypothetical protein
MSLSHHLAMECRIEQGRIQAIAAISQVLTYFISFRKTALPIAAYSRMTWNFSMLIGMQKKQQ